MSADDKVVSFSDKKDQRRGQRLWDRAISQRQEAKLSLARTLLMTRSYKQTEGLPPSLRRAKAFEQSAPNGP